MLAVGWREKEKLLSAKKKKEGKITYDKKALGKEEKKEGKKENFLRPGLCLRLISGLAAKKGGEKLRKERERISRLADECC